MIDLVAQSGPEGVQESILRIIPELTSLRDRILIHPDLRWLRDVEFLVLGTLALSMNILRNHDRGYNVGELLRFILLLLMTSIFLNEGMWRAVTSATADIAFGFSNALFQAAVSSNTASQSELPMAFIRMFTAIELEFDFEFFGLLTSNPFAILGAATIDLLLVLIGFLMMVIAFSIMMMLTFVFHVWVVFGYALLSAVGAFFLPFILLESTRPMFFAWLRLFLGTLLAWPFIVLAMMVSLLALSALWDVSFFQFFSDGPIDPIPLNVSGITTIIPAMAISIVSVVFIIVAWRWAYQVAGAGAGAVQGSFGSSGMGVV